MEQYQITSVSNNELTYETSNNQILSENYCRISFDKGQRLLRRTLANHFRSEYWNLIAESGFYLCPTKDCPVYYFNNNGETYLGKDDVHKTVMHKMEIGAEKRPVCYCKNVLESIIFDEVVVKKCSDSLIDIQNFTEANT
ncbi:MAG: Copper chaperone CopZ [Candidatus Heimdallarchaeota archaeon LC_2]|nr:MAG: Copper chaperone CopZ [Candidatus Heimdallarchaeota archaeon LC_2]